MTSAAAHRGAYDDVHEAATHPYATPNRGERLAPNHAAAARPETVAPRT